MGDECLGLQQEHIAKIAKLESEVDMLKDVISEIKNLHITLVEMTGENKVILTTLETQGRTLEKNVQAQEKIISEIQEIRDVMSTKDSLVRLHDRVDCFEDKLEEVTCRPDKEMATEYKTLKKWLFGILGTEAVVFVIGCVKYFLQNN